jgi:4-amino-4-deoxy-L-arabinose transferase-like glycosyltransferase
VGRLAELACLILALAVALWLRLENIGVYTGSFDEGIRSEQMLLMAAGFRPFRDIFASQGPILLDLLFPFYLGFGQSLEAIRLGVVITSIVAMIGAYWTARLAAGPIAGIATLGLLAISPAFLESSRLALAEAPSLAPSIWAVGAALRYQATGRVRWGVAAGVLLALGVLVKPMVLAVCLPVALLVFLRRPLSISGLAAFATAGLVTTAMVIFVLGPSGVYEDLAAYRGGASHTLGGDAPANWRLTAAVLARERLAIVGLAFAAALGAIRLPRILLPLVAWPLAVAVLFLVYDDLADKHIVYLTFPLSLLAGIGIGGTIAAINNLVRTRRLSYAIIGVVGVIAAVSYLGDISRVWRADVFMLHEAGRVAENRRDIGSELEIADIMTRLSGPSEYVITDNPNAAFRARRLVPPKLVDTSGTRIDAGSLTDALAINTAERYQPPIIVTAPNRMAKLSGFVRWMVDGRYDLVKTYDVGWKVYLRQGLTL